MTAINPNDLENTSRRIAEALEKIAIHLEQINGELRETRENIRHKVKMDNK